MYGKIVNLTQHKATDEQIKEGVVEPLAKKRVKKLLTFEEFPTGQEIRERALKLAFLAQQECDMAGYRTVMIGGAPFFMSTLERELKSRGLMPVYAFSLRESTETEDGKKVSVFRHQGFVKPA